MHLEELSLLFSIDANVNFEHLKTLIGLQKLMLFSSGVLACSGVTYISNLSQLNELSLSHCDLGSDEAIDCIGTLTRLRCLSLRRCSGFSSASLASLGNTTSLRELNLGLFPQFTDADFAHLETLNRLPNATLHLRRNVQSSVPVPVPVSAAAQTHQYTMPDINDNFDVPFFSPCFFIVSGAVAVAVGAVALNLTCCAFGMNILGVGVAAMLFGLRLFAYMDNNSIDEEASLSIHSLNMFAG